MKSSSYHSVSFYLSSINSFKSGKVVIVLSGRYAGRKAVVIRASDEGNANKRFGHCLVAGLDRAPRKIVKAMSKKKQEKRSKVKPFLKLLNYNHIMPTRYSVDFDMKKEVTGDVPTDKGEKSKWRKEQQSKLKALFEDKYINQSTVKDRKASGAAYFFQKLRF